METNERPRPISFKREYVISAAAAKIVVRLLMDKPGAPATFAVIRDETAKGDRVRLQMSARSEDWLLEALREHLKTSLGGGAHEILKKWLEAL